MFLVLGNVGLDLSALCVLEFQHYSTLKVTVWVISNWISSLEWRYFTEVDSLRTTLWCRNM